MLTLFVVGIGVEHDSDLGLSFCQMVFAIEFTKMTNRAIREIAGKLKEIDKILTNNIKLKTETGVDKGKYWKSTRKTLYRIAERMSGISEKLRRF